MWCDPLGVVGINLNRFADSGIVQNDAVGSVPGNNEKDELGRVRVVWEIKITAVQSGYRALVMSVKRRCNARSIARARVTHDKRHLTFRSSLIITNGRFNYYPLPRSFIKR